MLAETPDDAELRYFLAMAYVSDGDEESALSCFRQPGDGKSRLRPRLRSERSVAGSPRP